MSGVNKVIIIGNLGNDPEVNNLPSGGMVANISVATSEKWKDKNTGQVNERTEWHKIVFFNRLAEIAAQYLKKGSKVYVMGSLRTRKWQDNAGQDRYTTEIVGNEIQMLDSGGQSQQPAQQQRPAQQPNQQPNQYHQSAQQQPAPQRPAQPQYQQPQQTAQPHQLQYQQPAQQHDPYINPNINDDIPF